MTVRFAVLAVLLAGAPFVYAQPAPKVEARRADINKDRIVDKKEKKIESDWEKGAPLNKDAIVDGVELRLWREKIDRDSDKVVKPGESARPILEKKIRSIPLLSAAIT